MRTLIVAVLLTFSLIGCAATGAQPTVAKGPIADGEPQVCLGFTSYSGDAEAVVALANDLHASSTASVVLDPTCKQKLAHNSLPDGVKVDFQPRLVAGEGKQAAISVAQAHEYAAEFRVTPNVQSDGTVRIAYEFDRWVACGSTEWGAGNHWTAHGEFSGSLGSTVARLVRSPESELPVLIVIRLLREDELTAMTSN